MPEEHFTHIAPSSAHPDEVWTALNRAGTWEAIPGVDHIINSTKDGQGRLTGFTFSTTVGGRTYRGDATPRERIEGSLLAWNITTPELKGSIAVKVSPADFGSTVEVELVARSAGVLSGMFFPLIVKAIGSGFPRTVEEFAANLG